MRENVVLLRYEIVYTSQDIGNLVVLTPPEHQSRTIDAKYVNISRC